MNSRKNQFKAIFVFKNRAFFYMNNPIKNNYVAIETTTCIGETLEKIDLIHKYNNLKRSNINNHQILAF